MNEKICMAQNREVNDLADLVARKEYLIGKLSCAKIEYEKIVRAIQQTEEDIKKVAG